MQTLLKNDCFRDMLSGDIEKISDVAEFKITDEPSLKFDPKFLRKYSKKDAKVFKPVNLKRTFFADCEADAIKGKHKPYLICVKNVGGKIIKKFHGANCVEEFLKIF
jgi:hypothetical protein